MINDIQLITKSTKTAEESTVIVKVGAGKAGQPTVIKAQAGVSYELRDIIKNRAPDQLLFKRKGKDLLILLNAEGKDTDQDQPADIVIENYYGEGKVKLIGLSEDGQYYTYLPQEGTPDLLSWKMSDGASTYQSLGELHEQVAWWPFVLAGLGAGIAAASGGGGAPDPVNTPPVAKNDTVVVDEDSSVNLNPTANDTDADGDKLTVTQINGTTITPGKAQNISVPNGVVHIAADGTITFKPNPNYNGSVEFPYTISDGKGGTSSAIIHITVNPVDDPSVLTPDTKTIDEDLTATGNVLTNDSDVDNVLTVATFTVNGVTVKAGETTTIAGVGTISIGTNGDYTFVPVANWNGTVPTITYTTNTGSSSTLDIIVNPKPDTPSVSDDVATTPEDTPVIIDVLANDLDVDGDKLTVTQIDGKDVTVGVPVVVAHGTATLNSDGTITFTPNENYNGPATFTYTATDGMTPVTGQVDVQVTPVNDPPVATDDKVTAQEDTPITIDVLSNDKDADGDKLTITEINGTPIKAGETVAVDHGTVTLNPDGTITFNPDDGYNGPANFDYTVSDGKGGTDTASVSVDVGGVNDAPIAANDSNSTDENTALTVAAASGVLTNDSDPDGDTLSVSQVSNGTGTANAGQAITGAWGTLTINADGSYTYTPNAAAQALDDGESQTDVFTYTVKDPAGLTATATLSITVNGKNDAPVAVDDSAITGEEQPVIIDVLKNDTDVDGDPLTITEINGTPIKAGETVPVDNGTVTLNPDGTITFTPASDYNGSVDFTYTVSDGTSTDTAGVHVVVDDVNDPPVAEDETVVGQEDAALNFKPLSNDADPDGDALTITEINGTPIAVGTPVAVDNGVISLNSDGSLTFTPNKDYNGTFTFDYTISDGRGGTDVGTTTVIINPVDDPSVMGPDTQTIVEDTIATGNVLSNDSDVDKEDNPLSVVSFTIDGVTGTFNAGDIATIPGVGTITIGADGKYSFDPADNWTGTVPTIHYTINTGSQSTLNINVTPEPFINITADPAVAIEGETTGVVFHIDQTGVGAQDSTVVFKLDLGELEADDIQSITYTDTAGVAHTVSLAEALAGITISIPLGTAAANMPTVTVVPVNDKNYEVSENFSATISVPKGANIGIDSASGTIKDDGDADTPTIAISAVAADVTEGPDVYATFALTKTGESEVDGKVQVALNLGTGANAAEAADFDGPLQYKGTDGQWHDVPADGWIPVGASATTDTIELRIKVVDDSILEHTETFSVEITGVSELIKGTATAAGSITDENNGLDDTPTIAISAVAADVTEGPDVYATFALTKTGESEVDGKVQVALNLGTGANAAEAADFDGPLQYKGTDGQWHDVPADGWIPVGASATTDTIELRIKVVDDSILEHTETFSVEITGVSELIKGTATAAGSITDENNGLDDTPTIAISAVAADVTEGPDVYATFALTKTGESEVDGKVQVALNLGTGANAAEAADFDGPLQYKGTDGQWHDVPADGWIPVGASATTDTIELRIKVVDDSILEHTETFSVEITGVSELIKGTATAAGSITDENNGLDDTPTIAISAVAADVTEGPDVYATFALTKTGESEVDGKVQVALNLGTGANAAEAADFDGPLQYKGTDGQWHDVPADGWIPVGASATTDTIELRIKVVDDSILEHTETFSVEITGVSELIKGTATAAGSITDENNGLDDTPTIAISAVAADVTEGPDVYATFALTKTGESEVDGKVQVALNLGTGANAAEAADFDGPLQYKGTDGQWHDVPADGWIPVGASATTDTIELRIKVVDDSILEHTETFSVEITGVSELIKGTATAAGSITDDPADTASVQLTVSEEGLVGGIKDNLPDSSVDTTDSATANNALSPVKLGNAVDAIQINSVVTSGGETVIWSAFDPVTHSIVGTIANGTVKVMSVKVDSYNSVTGDTIFAVDLLKPIDHAGINEDVQVVSFTANAGSLSADITVKVEDDAPSVTASGTAAATLTVDESDLATNASASFANVFTVNYGADGAGSTAYALKVVTAASGLVDTATGEAVTMSVDASGNIVGKTATSGATVFTISVSASGVVTLDQARAVQHSDGSNANDTAALAANSISLTATATDKDGDSASQTVNLGAGFVFTDDAPTVTATAANAATLTVDETTLATNASASFANVFSVNYGADGAGSTAYALKVVTAASGLVDTATGEAVTMSVDASGNIVGKTATSGATVFTISVSASGVVTLDQARAVQHSDGSNANDTVALAANSISLTATATDKDGDSASQTVNLGAGFVFTDDAPTVTATAANAATLTVDETTLATNASASFANVFSVNYGADGAGSTAYALKVVTAASGLIDTATGQAVTMSVVNGQIVGTAGGNTVFTISVSASGVVTLDQVRAVQHADGNNANDTVTLAANSISLTATATDKDGDKASQTVNLGAGFVFTDDAPTVTASGTAAATLTVDESDLATNASASFANVFTVNYGADGAGSTAYALNVVNAASGLIDTATGQAVTMSVVNGQIVGTAGGNTVFTISVSASGVVTLDQARAVQHADGSNANDTVALAANSISLTATATDKDGDSASQTVNLGAGFVFTDDAPTVTATAANAATLTVDETTLATNASASFANVFSVNYGADGAGSTAYALKVVTAASGLVDTATGEAVTMSVDASGNIVGKTATSGATVFTISVSASGVVTLDQARAVQHSDGSNANDTVALAANSISLTATATDKDGDSASQTVNLGAGFVFTDDAPTVSMTAASGVTVTLDETSAGATTNGTFATAITATSSASVLNPTISYGADGAGSTVYSLTAVTGASGLKTAAGDYSINLVQTNSTTVTGTFVDGAGATKTAFTIVMGTDGKLTVTQNVALEHNTDGNTAAAYDDILQLAAGKLTASVKVTDKDGDSASVTGVDISSQVIFKDDGPSASDVTATTILDEDGLTNGIPGGPGDVAGAAITATGSLVYSGGADGAASIVLSYAGTTLGTESVTSVWDTATSTLTISSTRGALMTVSVDQTTGTYTANLLKPLMHPVNSTEDNITLPVKYTVTDNDGDTASATLTLTINDDMPTVDSGTQEMGIQPAATNLMIVLDISGSMGDYVSSTQTRLDMAKDAVMNLITAYDKQGEVRIEMVTFSTYGQASSVWMTTAQAMVYINALTANCGTNYDDALQKAMDGFGSPGKLDGAQNIAYFLTDGKPTYSQGGTGSLKGSTLTGNGSSPTSSSDNGIQSAEEAIWKQFLIDNKIITYSLGMGSDLTSTDRSYIDPIAYNGATSSDLDGIIVSDMSQLHATLQSLVILPTVQTNLLRGNLAVNSAGFGADGGEVLIFTMAGRTYNYNSTTGALTATGTSTSTYTYDSTEHVVTITTSSGAKMVLDMDTGDYSYQAGNAGSSYQEQLSFSVKDKDGDVVIPPKRAASKSRINTSPAFSAGRVSLLKPSYAFALE